MADQAPPRSIVGRRWIGPPDAGDGRSGSGRSGGAFEVKFDRVNGAIGYASPGGLRLFSRNDRDISGSYPEVGALDLGKGVIVDGELVALDGHGRPDFGLLQHRMRITRPTAELGNRVSVQYVVFDLLHRKDRSLLDELKVGDGNCWTAWIANGRRRVATRDRSPLTQWPCRRPTWRTSSMNCAIAMRAPRVAAAEVDTRSPGPPPGGSLGPH